MIPRLRELYANRFKVDQLGRKVEDLNGLIQQFQQLARDLDCQVRAEEERTRITDQSHVSYSLIAKAAAQRRDNLLASLRELEPELQQAIAQREEALAALNLAAMTIAKFNEQAAQEARATPKETTRSRILAFPRSPAPPSSGDHHDQGRDRIAAKLP